MTHLVAVADFIFQDEAVFMVELKEEELRLQEQQQQQQQLVQDVDFRISTEGEPVPPPAVDSCLESAWSNLFPGSDAPASSPSAAAAAAALTGPVFMPRNDNYPFEEKEGYTAHPRQAS